MERILVADAALSVRRTLTGLLSQGGYEVLESRSVKDLLAKATEEQVDLILVDASLPGNDDLKAVSQLRGNPDTGSIPVIVMGESAKGESLALHLGASSYVIKPFQKGIIEAAVRAGIRDREESRAPVARPPKQAAREPASPREREDNDRPENDEVPDTRVREDGGRRNGGRTMTAIPTGMPQLDQMLRGGVPVGVLALIEGNPASGKSTLCQHLAYEALEGGQSVAYLASERTPEDLVSQMGSLGMEVSKHARAGRLRIYALEKSGAERNAEVLAGLAAGMDRLPEEYGIVIVDSITGMAAGVEDSPLMGFFSTCHALSQRQRTCIISARTHVFHQGLLRRVHSLCNTHITLGEETMGARSVKTASVGKVRSVEMGTGAFVCFQVQPDIGMRFVPGARVRI